MNYIPGFSNYLETSVPRYADGGAVMDPSRQAAVMPMATEAAPADYLSQLQALGMSAPDLTALNNFKGFAPSPSMGGSLEGLNFGLALPADYKLPYEHKYFTAPISNKGNKTGYSADNTFFMMPDRLVRLVDYNTNTVVFEGTGYEAAQKAVELGQKMTDTMGRKANYQIQTSTPGGSYQPVANEKRNKSTLGKIASVAGTALPLATMFVPGLNVLGTIALGAGLGGAGAALKGDNILKGAALGGLSAAGGQVLGPALGAGGALGTNLAPKLATAIGTGLGTTAGGLVTGQSLKSSLLGGVASGALSYVAPDIQRELGIGQGASANTSGGGGGSTGDIVVSGYRPVSIGTSLGGSPNKIQQALNPKPETPYDGLTVTGNRFGNVSGVNFGNQYGAPTDGPPPLDKLTEQPTPEEVEEILVRARKSFLSPEVLAAIPAIGGLAAVTAGGGSAASNVVNGIDQATGDIVVKAPQAVTPPPPITGIETALPTITGGALTAAQTAGTPPEGKKLGLEDYLRLAGRASGILGNIGAGGGQGQTGTYGAGRLNPIFSAKLPTANIPGVGAASNLGVRPMDEQDWLTYAERPEQSFYNYVPQPTGMAEGGALPAKHGGSPDRTEFAVKGPGTGRSDDIPAVLSDGEYVIDAETVALLGDGSSKAGAKKLDDLRVKVRKHKGEKLAKGRFSANAKKPEAYLSGGRI